MRKSCAELFCTANDGCAARKKKLRARTLEMTISPPVYRSERKSSRVTEILYPKSSYSSPLVVSSRILFFWRIYARKANFYALECGISSCSYIVNQKHEFLVLREIDRRHRLSVSLSSILYIYYDLGLHTGSNGVCRTAICC